jgi:hypothetical protein
MRIIKDIFPMPLKQEQIQEQIQEISDYNPSLENFLTCFSKEPLSNIFHELCIKSYIWFNRVFSENLYIKWKEKKILKQVLKHNEKQRKRKIMLAVHSYKNNMNNFNSKNTCFEKMWDDSCKKEIYKREHHKTIKNRNVERHWK